MAVDGRGRGFVRHWPLGCLAGEGGCKWVGFSKNGGEAGSICGKRPSAIQTHGKSRTHKRPRGIFRKEAMSLKSSPEWRLRQDGQLLGGVAKGKADATGTAAAAVPAASAVRRERRVRTGCARCLRSDVHALSVESSGRRGFSSRRPLIFPYIRNGNTSGFPVDKPVRLS